MKTYEEMAQSVIRRAKAHKTVRNRWIALSVAAMLALGLCLGVVAVNRPEGEPMLQTTTTAATEDQTIVSIWPPRDSLLATLPSTEANNRVTFLYGDGSQISDMQKDVKTPFRMEIRVKDITELSEAEAEDVCKSEGEYAKNLIAANPDTQGYLWTQFDYSNIVVTTISAGYFIIGMEDPKQIESIVADVEGVVHMSHMSIADEDYWLDPGVSPAKKFALDHSDILKGYYAPYGGVNVSWRLSNSVMRKMNEGTVSVGDLSDTITFTVTYVDGTVETHAIDMIFNESGEVYALYRGVTAAA